MGPPSGLPSGPWCGKWTPAVPGRPVPWSTTRLRTAPGRTRRENRQARGRAGRPAALHRDGGTRHPGVPRHGDGTAGPRSRCAGAPARSGRARAHQDRSEARPRELADPDLRPSQEPHGRPARRAHHAAALQRAARQQPQPARPVLVRSAEPAAQHRAAAAPAHGRGVARQDAELDVQDHHQGAGAARTDRHARCLPGGRRGAELRAAGGRRDGDVPDVHAEADAVQSGGDRLGLAADRPDAPHQRPDLPRRPALQRPDARRTARQARQRRRRERHPDHLGDGSGAAGRRPADGVRRLHREVARREARREGEERGRGGLADGAEERLEERPVLHRPVRRPGRRRARSPQDDARHRCRVRRAQHRCRDEASPDVRPTRMSPGRRTASLARARSDSSPSTP